MVAWERDTIQPKYGINLGVEYTHAFGVGELYDYDWFFDGFPRTIRHGRRCQGPRHRTGARDPLLSAPLLRHVEHAIFRHPLLSERLAGTISRRMHRSCSRPSRSIPEAGSRTTRAAGVAPELAGDRTSRSGATGANSPAPGWSTLRDGWRSAAELSGVDRNRSMQEMVYGDDPFWHDATDEGLRPPQIGLGGSRTRSQSWLPIYRVVYRSRPRRSG